MQSSISAEFDMCTVQYLQRSISATINNSKMINRIIVEDRLKQKPIDATTKVNLDWYYYLSEIKPK